MRQRERHRNLSAMRRTWIKAEFREFVQPEQERNADGEKHQPAGQRARRGDRKHNKGQEPDEARGDGAGHEKFKLPIIGS